MEKFITVLKTSPLFRELNDDAIAAVLEGTHARAKTAKADEYILRAGETTSSMGVVLTGSVMVIQEDLWGHRNIMARIPAGDIFAEIFAAARGAVLNVSVVAESDCEVMMLDVSRLLLGDFPAQEARNQVVRNLISVLAGKTMVLNNKVTHISKRTTREKLLSFLSAEAIRRGSLCFDIPYNRQQLADYLCVERAAMSVELSRLQKEGILTYNRNHFELSSIGTDFQ